MTRPSEVLAAYTSALDGDPGPAEIESGQSLCGAAGSDEPNNAVDGARFILDEPGDVPAIWGSSRRVLWARGEALMIAGGQGLGKTTLAGQLTAGLLGVGDGRVLGLPVVDLGCVILYMAMDRPRQIARSLRRQFALEDRSVLSERLVVWEGPPPRDLAANPALLARMASYYKAGLVVVDSLKDAAVRLSEDAVGAQWNRARQHLLAQGCQLLELHHSTKRGPAGGPIAGVADIYGSTWLTSGCGSIILLTGEPGDPIVSFRHVKQPAEEVGPWQLLHDQSAGHLSIDFQIDLVELVKAAGVDGLTAKSAAVAVTGKENPSRADVEKARRRLDKLVEADALVRMDGRPGGTRGGSSAAWFLAERTVHERSRTDEKAQVNGVHGLFDQESDHGSFTPFTQSNITAGQSVHADNHADHAASVHVSPRPFKGRANGTPAEEIS